MHLREQQQQDRVADFGNHKQSAGVSSEFQDNRPEAIAQRKLQQGVNQSPQVQATAQLQRAANAGHTAQLQSEETEATVPDIPALAKKIYDAIDGWGTDEDAVYAALAEVRGNPAAIQELKAHYEQTYGESLDAAIRGDFSGDEEARALSYFGNEFIDLETYKAETGQNELGRYQWLKEDREGQTGTWLTACENITRDKKAGQLQPFVQVRDYYVWVTRELDKKGHESRWVKGALYLVDELSEVYDEGVTSGRWWITPDKEVIPLLEDLNVGIVDYAITQFYRLLYGDMKDDPLKGEAAYEFDRQFIEKEQGDVAYDVYDKYEGTDALEAMNGMFNGSSLAGWAASIVSSEIPTFPDYFGADLTDKDSRYGQDARTNVPLYMLYPDRHRAEEYPEINALLDIKEVDERGVAMTPHGGVPYEIEGGQDPDDVYEAYSRVNRNIMNKEW